MSFHKPSKKTILIALIVVFFCSLLIIGAVLIDRYLSDRPVYESSASTITIGDTEYRQKNLTTVMLIGLDCDGGIETNNSNRNYADNDVDMLLVIDPSTNESFILQLDRDTVLKIDELGFGGRRTGSVLTEQLALAHTYGDGGTVSDLNVCRAVSKFLYGVIVDNYITFTMSAVPVINDFVGGVTLTMAADYTSLDPSFVTGATVTLQGEQALSFIRARQNVDDETNVARMTRQRAYIDAFMTKFMKKAASEDELTELYQTLSEPRYISTDISVGGFQTLLEQFKATEFKGFVTLKGTHSVVDGYTQFAVDETDLQNVLIEYFLVEK